MVTTIKTPVQCSGIGLHSGQPVRVKLLPGDRQSKRYFVRTDLPGEPVIPARVTAVGQTTLSTELVSGEATLRTTEHLLATLVGLGIDAVRIEVDGPELPLLDGSAAEWVEAIAPAGTKTIAPDAAPPIAITQEIWVREGDAFVAALPASSLRFSYGIDFIYGPIGNQWHSWYPATEPFAEAIAPARTFGFADQIKQLKKAGLIQGGSLDNALVCDREKWLNPPLRFPNEPARHKLLDLVGDLALLGQIPPAHYLAYKASHRLHTQLAQKIQAQSVIA